MSHISVDLNGNCVDWERVITKVCEYFPNFSRPQVAKYRHIFVSKNIINQQECEYCGDSGEKLYQLLWRRNSEQIKQALEIICEDTVNKDFKKAVECAISKKALVECVKESPASEETPCLKTTEQSESRSGRMSKIMNAGLTLLLILGILTICGSTVFLAAKLSGAVHVNNNVNVNVGDRSAEGLQTKETLPTATPTVEVDDQDQVPRADKTLYLSSPEVKAEFPQTLALTSSNTTPDNFKNPELTLLKSTFNPPKYYPIYIDSVKNANFFTKILCNSTVKKGLNLSLEKPFEPHHFRLKCTHLVHALEISGNFTVDNLLLLLRKFFSVEFLHVNARFLCPLESEGTRNFSDVNLTLPNLVFLKVSNIFSDCSELLTLLGKIVGDKRATLQLENVQVMITNVDLIEKLVANSPLKSLSFNGTLCPNCEFFQNSSFTGNLTTLHFHVREGSGGLVSMKNIVKSPSLESFLSNVEIPTGERHNFLRKFVNVRILSFKLGLKDTIYRFSVNSLLSICPKVKEASVELDFKNGSICKSLNQSVYITNLRSVNETRLSLLEIKAKCKLSAVKGWQLKCREYAFLREGDMQSVRISGVKHSQSCMQFWGV